MEMFWSCGRQRRLFSTQRADRYRSTFLRELKLPSWWSANKICAKQQNYARRWGQKEERVVKVRKIIKLFPLHGRVRVRIFDWEITMGSVQGTARRQSKPGFSSRFSQNLRISPFSFLSSRLVVYFIVHHRVREFLQRHLTAFVTWKSNETENGTVAAYIATGTCTSKIWCSSIFLVELHWHIH